MSRVQLALRVADLEAAVAFYSRLFDTEPAKRRPGYANFAVVEPPLKLVLLEGAAGEPTRMDHLGVEVPTADEVSAATARLAADVPRTARTHRFPSLGTRFASWAERPRAGRSQGVCCPA